MTVYETDPDRTGGEAPPGPATMRAIVADRYGTPGVLSVRRVDRPVPGDDQVLIRVVAASLNMYDWHMMTGKPYMARMVAGLTAPKHPVPGADLAGVVEEIGRNVTDLAVGDEVFGDVGHGAFGEYALATERHVARKPDGVTFEQAAAVPLAAMTALQGLRDHGGLQAGRRVLVNGASGGVGTFAVQIAKALGAEVTAVCSTGKVDMVRGLGADRVIDYTKDDFTATERGYDLLFDNVGDRPWRATRRVLAPDGINVTVTGPKHAVVGPLRDLVARKIGSLFGGKRMTWFTAGIRRSDLEFLGDLLSSGDLVPVIEATYPLEQVPDAMRYLGEGHARGKLVVTM
jgi:NADPH:quinone reductase-like Zn-dependent oxidoreductase